MMPNLAEIYDRAFFQEWGRHNEKYVSTARKIASHLYEVFRPKRIADVGCGCGIYAHLFRSFGVEVLAIDGVLPPAQEAFVGDVVLRDLTEPFPNEWGEFDFSLCFDVAEHIPENFVDVYLSNLTGLSDTLLLSAAPPNQGGTHHVNERPKRYWVGRLEKHGMIYQREKTGLIVEHFKRNKPGFMWMCQHISVYERKSA